MSKTVNFKCNKFITKLSLCCSIKSVTSDNNERANSTLKLVKGYLCTNMTKGRLSDLAMMNIQLFAERYPRRMVVVDLVFDEIVVIKTWYDLKPPKTIYNHLQPPQKHLQQLANNLKPSKTRYKCLK